jgi:MFS family permease
VTVLGRRYRQLWAASTVSNLGDGVSLTAFPLLAASLTRDPVLVSLLGFTQYLPWLLFALVAGALVDRFDRRRTMWRVDTFRAGLIGLLGLLVAMDKVHLVILYVAAFLLGTAETLFDNASQALMPSLVDRSALETANGRLYAAEIVTNQFIGPPLGGFLFAAAAATPFLLDAGSFIGAAILVALIPGTFRVVQPRTETDGSPTEAVRHRIRTDIAEGLRWLWGHRLLRSIAMALGVTNLLNAAGMGVMVLLAQDELGLGSAGYGVLLTAGAIGSVAGGLVASRISVRWGPGPTLIGCLVMMGLQDLGIALASSAWLAGAALVLGGVSAVTWNVLTVSLRQSIIPDRLLGRVNSAYRFLGWGAIPVGALVGGVLANAFGLRAPFFVSAVGNVVLAALLVGAVNTRSIEDARAQATAN